MFDAAFTDVGLKYSFTESCARQSFFAEIEFNAGQQFNAFSESPTHLDPPKS